MVDFEGGNAERPFVLGAHYNGEAKSGTNGTGKTGGGSVNYELGTSYKLAPAGVYYPPKSGSSPPDLPEGFFMFKKNEEPIKIE